MRPFLLLLSFLFATTAVLFAQDSIDDLFNDPDAGIIEEEPGEQVDVAALTEQSGPDFAGSASAEAALSAGLSSWDESIPLEDRADVSALYQMRSALSLDARPTSATRFRARVSAAAPASGTVSFDQISLDELFLEYTLRGSLFFRVGLQSMRWGNGEFFNPANLISPANGAISVRAFTPLGRGGLTAVAIAKDGFFSDPDLPGIAEIGYAGRLEWNRSPFSGTLAGYYQAESGPRTAASVKFPLFGTDVSLEGVVNWDESDISQNTYDALLATFWEGTDWGLQFVGEYLFESERLPDGLGSRVGIGLLATDLLPRWNPGVRWYHAFFDNSGEVILGADGPVADNLRMSVALPISYGADGTTYRVSTEDPLGRAIALVLRVTLSVSF